MSSLLLNCLPYVYSDIRSLDQSITSLVIPKLGCNDFNNTFMCFSRFTQIESIETGNDCFGSVKRFQIDGLNRLKTIKIGNNSFTQKKQNTNHYEPKLFFILNCESLESIEIGERSFSDFAGKFELKNLPKLQSIQIGERSFNYFGGKFESKNLPQLQSIQIGTIGGKSYNFHDSSFVIRGIELILNYVMIRSSKSAIHYIRK